MPCDVVREFSKRNGVRGSSERNGVVFQKCGSIIKQHRLLEERIVPFQSVRLWSWSAKSEGVQYEARIAL